MRPRIVHLCERTRIVRGMLSRSLTRGNGGCGVGTSKKFPTKHDKSMRGDDSFHLFDLDGMLFIF